jgi:pimeloyl-ACP methyl ester carboxylesterase
LKRFFLVLGSDFHSQAGFVAQRIFPGADQEILRSELIRQITMADVRIYRSAMLSLAFFNAEKRLTSIQTPTLVITGATDTTVDPQLQARLARGIPGAIHVVIPGAGHAVTADHPQVFNQVLLKFLEGGNLTGPEGCPFETGGLDQNISPSS